MLKINIEVKLSDIIAILAIIISIYTCNSQISFAKTNSVKNLESIYFNAIFKDILIYKIPKAQKKIYINESGKIQDDSDFIKLLNEIRNKSLYFKYTDKDFYDRLVKKLQDLEDYIVNRGNKQILDRNIFLQSINEKVEDLYRLLIEYYKNL